jgi:transposase
MRFYTSTTRYHCGIDLHSKQMYVCVMDSQGNKLLHMNIKNNDFAFFLKKIAPWRNDMTVCCECLFCWYWLADACVAAALDFVLAIAIYHKPILGGKKKNDRIDSEKLAHLLRSNLIPPSYAYPAAKRPIRALLRQRTSFVWQRVELLQRICTMRTGQKVSTSV